MEVEHDKFYVIMDEWQVLIFKSLDRLKPGEILYGWASSYSEAEVLMIECAAGS